MRAVPASSRVLEIGPGDGRLAYALADAGYEVVAVDREQRSSFPTVVTDFKDYDSKGTRFDCVVAALVLHHVADLDQTLQKIRMLLKPAGIVAIDDYGWERIDERAARNQWGVAWERELKGWLQDRVDLHTSHTMLEALDRYFTKLLYEEHSYFQDGLSDDMLAFVYVGRTRPEAVAPTVSLAP